jgi:serine/threonine protein kinase
VKDIAPDVTLNGVHVPHLESKDLIVEEEVGRGGWGVVYRARYIGSQLIDRDRGEGTEEADKVVRSDEKGVQEQLVALKRFKSLSFDGSSDDANPGAAHNSLDDNERRETYLEFQKEVSMNGSLSHPRLVQMLGLITEPAFGIVMEFMGGGDLYTFINDKARPLSWGLRLQLALDVAEGMRFLHSLKLMHRDLKSPNILLQKRDASRLIAKVADFGLAREIESIVPGDQMDIANPVWLAPEVLLGQRPTLKVSFFRDFVFSPSL